jgi:hypothetical protein
MLVEYYNFGKIIINGKTYTSDVVVSREWIFESWWRKEGHAVHLEDIKKILEKNPEIVIFGTGKYGMVKVSKEVVNELKKRNIELVVDITEKAAKIYNEMIKKGKNAVLAAHLTC